MSPLNRLREALAVLRPRALAQLRKSVDDQRTQMREQRVAAKQFEDQAAAGQRRLEQALDELGRQQREHAAEMREVLTALRRDLDRLALRESQLRAVAQADLDQAEALPQLDAILGDRAAIAAHVEQAIRSATLEPDPFPHMVVDDLLPRPLFDAVIAGLPPAELFADRPVNHQHLQPPFDLAPRYARRVWGFLRDVVVNEVVMPAVLARLREPLNGWIRDGFALTDPDPLAALRMTTSDGRLLLRRRGYRIPPHRDPKWGFITCLLYLPRPGDDDRWGTQLYRVKDDEEARGAKPYWIRDEQCIPVVDVAFRANRMLVFLNSVGAHGAFIPEDAEPADLERYAYQFRIGPVAASLAKLMAGLPEDRKPFWAGKRDADYA